MTEIQKKRTPKLIIELPASLVGRCEAAAKWMPTRSAKDLRNEVLTLATAAALTAAEAGMLSLEKVAGALGEKTDA